MSSTLSHHGVATAARDATDLFPPLGAYRHGWLDTQDGHRLYWEESGNPDGLPVLFLHGGPGAGCSPIHRRFFDPSFYRIILLDQRGAGRSTPHAGLNGNTTAALIKDIESLRAALSISSWLIFGGSWGSTLALAYGEAHPDHCLGFILRGVFLFRPQEVEWFLHGMGRLFPEAERAFIGHLPPDERGNRLESYYRRLTNPDPLVNLSAAQAWCAYEEACSRLIPETTDGHLGPPCLPMARIEAHYMMNNGFLEENQLLRDLHRIEHLPCQIVQGRYDVICPITTAYDLAHAWPKAVLHIIPDGGHSSLDPGIRRALIQATEQFKHMSLLS